jgi:hypothetical protein
MGKAKLAEMVKADGKPEGFHRGLWKPANGPREGGSGSWSVSLSTLKDFVKTQVLLARKSVAPGGAGARMLATNLHVKVRDMQPQPQPARVSIEMCPVIAHRWVRAIDPSRGSSDKLVTKICHRVRLHPRLDCACHPGLARPVFSPP